jgi:hypothetical protein
MTGFHQTENNMAIEVTASSTADKLFSTGSVGAIGDILTGVLIVPTSVSPGLVSILDGANTIVLFNGGASSLTELKPIWLPLNIRAAGAGWAVTTGADVAVVAVGKFS